MKMEDIAALVPEQGAMASPEVFQQLGTITRLLHDTMLDWYFEQTSTTVWLGTTPNTRAASFYRKAGWQEVGMHGKDELKFEMSQQQYLGLLR